jgi:membrane protein YqaA with SNARE-associated domain
LAVGTFAADGFHLPVPPQFYMLISIAGGLSALPVLLAICTGSVLGGCTGFVVARYLAAIPFIARRLDRVGRRPRELFEKYGAWAVVIASVTPIAYSALCYVTGALRLSPRLLLLACICRIPRLVAFYYLIQFGWA